MRFPLRVEHASDYRSLTAECEKRLDGYQYARRSTKEEKRDKELLRELRKFDPIFARYAAGEPNLTLERAKELHQASLETPIAARNRALAAKGGIAKSRQTKNQ
jgi:hypothetical protein